MAWSRWGRSPPPKALSRSMATVAMSVSHWLAGSDWPWGLKCGIYEATPLLGTPPASSRRAGNGAARGRKSIRVNNVKELEGGDRPTWANRTGRHCRRAKPGSLGSPNSSVVRTTVAKAVARPARPGLTPVRPQARRPRRSTHVETPISEGQGLLIRPLVGDKLSGDVNEEHPRPARRADIIVRCPLRIPLSVACATT